MKPCDCRSMDDVLNMPESGAVGYNGSSLYLEPPNIVISTPMAAIKIPMIHFQRFAEWYLDDQK